MGISANIWITLSIRVILIHIHRPWRMVAEAPDSKALSGNSRRFTPTRRFTGISATATAGAQSNCQLVPDPLFRSLAPRHRLEAGSLLLRALAKVQAAGAGPGPGP